MSISIANNNISSSGTLTLNNRALSTVAFSGDYDDLTNKPSIGSGGTIVDSWSDNDGNWFRKYDDGWIEQGGVYTAATNTKTQTVSLNTNFAKNTYCVIISYSSTYTNERTINTSHVYNSCTVSQFKAYIGYVDHETHLYWTACGY